MLRRISTPLVVLCALAVPTQAFAVEEGVFVDPSSPSGKEYALPLEAARGVGSPSSDGPGPPTPPAAFGEGISDPTSADEPGQATTGGTPERDDDPRGTPSRDAPERSDAAPDADTASSTGAEADEQLRAVSPADRSTEVASGGIGLEALLGFGVLLLGGGAALVFRRGQRQA